MCVMARCIAGVWPNRSKEEPFYCAVYVSGAEAARGVLRVRGSHSDHAVVCPLPP